MTLLFATKNNQTAKSEQLRFFLQSAFFAVGLHQHGPEAGT